MTNASNVPPSVAVSPEDQSSDRAQSDRNNAQAVATAKFSQTTLVRLLCVNFVVAVLTLVLILVLVARTY